MVEFGDPKLPHRFWGKTVVNPATGCWVWTGSVRRRGYGRVRVNGGKQLPTHRVAYEALVGPIPAGMQLDHLCRVPGCVNPAHLEPVSQAENVRRGNSGVHFSSKTHCSGGHEFTAETTYVNAAGHRFCKICRRIWQRKYRANTSKPEGRSGS
jgi:hypothetical protein